MPVKTFTAATLTTSDVNTFLMDQAVVTCTAASRPTPVDGRVIYETDTETLRVYDGATWVAIWRRASTYTPTLAGMAIGTGGGATNTATFGFSGNTLTVVGSILFGTSGAIFPSAGITVTMPSGFTISPVFNLSIVGGVTFNDFGTTAFAGFARVETATTVRFVVASTSGAHLQQVATSTTVPFTWVPGDSIVWQAVVPGSF